MRTKIYIITTMFVLLISSCKKEDNEITNKHPEILGVWEQKTTMGGLDGFVTLTFSANLTYSMIPTRTEIPYFPISCLGDPYCETYYSGNYWFEENELCWNITEGGTRVSIDNKTKRASWKVNGNLLYIGSQIYYKK